MEMEEILWKADIVVYGQELYRYKVDDDFYDSTFQVFCVFKNDDESLPLPQNITLERVDPVTSCSGTNYNLNEDIILAIQRTESGNFQWHEVNVVPDGAAFEASEENLGRVIWICGLDEHQEPEGSSIDNGLPGCPAIPEIYRECVTCSETSTDYTCSGNTIHSSLWIWLSVFAIAYLCGYMT